MNAKLYWLRKPSRIDAGIVSAVWFAGQTAIYRTAPMVLCVSSRVEGWMPQEYASLREARCHDGTATGSASAFSVPGSALDADGRPVDKADWLQIGAYLRPSWGFTESELRLADAVESGQMEDIVAAMLFS